MVRHWQEKQKSHPGAFVPEVAFFDIDMVGCFRLFYSDFIRLFADA